MSEWQVHAACAVIGGLFAAGVGFGGAKLYRKLDRIEHWSGVRDALTVAAIWVFAVAAAGAAGATYGHEALDQPWQIGGLWGACGGILSPSAFGPLRDAVIRAGVRVLDAAKPRS